MKEKQILDTDNMKPKEPIDSENKEPEKPATEGNPFTDNQFFGGWITFKTTHTIMIADSNMPDTVPRMFERLQLVKPFEIAPVP